MPAKDVFEHHDGVIDEHADGKGETAERRDIERTAQQGHDDEGPDGADQDVHEDDDRGPGAAQKDEQRQKRKQAAPEQVVADEADGRIDVIAFVVDLDELESLRAQQIVVERVARDVQTPFDFQHVRADFAHGINRDAVAAEAADESVGFLVAEQRVADVADVDGNPVFAGEKRILDLLGRAELAERADDVAAFAFPIVASGRIFVLGAKGGANIGDGEAAGGQLLRIDDDLQLFFAAAEHVG